MKKIILILCIFFALAINTYAEEVTLTWDANTEHDLAGYKIYYKTGTVGGPPYDGTGILKDGLPADSPIDVFNVTEVTLELPDDGEYFFVATAYDSESPPNESGYSNEVSTRIDTTPPDPPTRLQAFIKKIISFFKRFWGKSLRIS